MYIKRCLLHQAYVLGHAAGLLPTQAPTVRRDVHAAVRPGGGDRHELCDEAGPPHQPEGAHQLLVVSDHPQDVTWTRTDRKSVV